MLRVEIDDRRVTYAPLDLRNDPNKFRPVAKLQLFSSSVVSFLFHYAVVIFLSFRAEDKGANNTTNDDGNTANGGSMTFKKALEISYKFRSSAVNDTISGFMSTFFY